MRAPWAVVLLAGCGFRLTTGSAAGDGGANDSSIDGANPIEDGDVIDAPTDGMPIDGTLQPTCTLAWLNHTISFDTPVSLGAINSTSYDRDPFVSADELTIWFSSGNTNSLGGGDVFEATRANRSQPFGTPVRDPDFSTTGGAETKMSMTQNRLYAVVASDIGGGAGGSDIYHTSRANTNAVWGALSRAQTMNLATASSELDPFITADGLSIYYSPALGPQRVLVAKRQAVTDPFTNPVEVTAVNDGLASSNFDPALFANDRVIVFASNRTATPQEDNIWYATRPNTTASFGAPILLPGVNTDFDDGDPHVSTDGCRIYFARNVGGGVDRELFSASAE
jgi:hypothetical protein